MKVTVFLLLTICCIGLVVGNDKYINSNRIYSEHLLRQSFPHNMMEAQNRLRLNDVIDSGVKMFYDKMGNHIINETEICPFHPFPKKLPNPLPSILSETFDLLTGVLQNVSNTQLSTPPGLMFSVIYKDEIIHQIGLGSKNLSQPGVPPNLDTIFYVGSITKLFPAIMTMQLYESGVIRSLDDPIQSFAPDFAINNPFSKTDPITWRAMLSQLSGLPRQTPCETCVDCSDVVNCNVTSEWIYNRSKYLDVILPTYTRPSYSNFGFALLGRVPEPIINQSFEDYVTDNILHQLGMNNTGFSMTSEVWSKMAQGYSFLLQPYSSYPPLGWETPAGGAFSSTRDLTKLLSQFLQAHNMIDSPILTATNMKRMMQIAFLDYDGQTIISYPWESFFIDSYFVRCKGGNTVGFSGVVCVVPELQFGFTVLLNVDIDTFSYAVPVMEMLVPAFYSALNSMPVEAPLPPNPEEYSGLFQASPSSKLKIKIYLDTDNGNDRMIMSLNHVPALNSTLVYVKEDLFQVVAPNTSPSRFMGTCQSIELGAFQYESLYFSPDKNYFHLGNGGVFERIE